MSDQDEQKAVEPHPIETLVDDLVLRQRNTLFPDVVANASNSDALMWHGSRQITKVQRVGVGVFGLAFLTAGVSLAFGEGLSLGTPIGIGFAAIGCKVIWNSVRKNKPKGSSEIEK